VAEDELGPIEERWAIRPEWVRDASPWDSEIEWLIGEVKRLRNAGGLLLAWAEDNPYESSEMTIALTCRYCHVDAPPRQGRGEPMNKTDAAQLHAPACLWRRTVEFVR
jgi:hypothetical protein